MGYASFTTAKNEGKNTYLWMLCCDCFAENQKGWNSGQPWSKTFTCPNVLQSYLSNAMGAWLDLPYLRAVMSGRYLKRQMENNPAKTDERISSGDKQVRFAITSPEDKGGAIWWRKRSGNLLTLLASVPRYFQGLTMDYRDTGLRAVETTLRAAWDSSPGFYLKPRRSSNPEIGSGERLFHPAHRLRARSKTSFSSKHLDNSRGANTAGSPGPLFRLIGQGPATVAGAQPLHLHRPAHRRTNDVIYLQHSGGRVQTLVQ